VTPSESHDEFLELCALATTDLLSGQERNRLQEHLRVCPTCGEVFAQYRELVSAEIPAASVASGFEVGAKTAASRSLDEAEAALFARLDREEGETESSSGAVPPARSAAQARFADPLLEIREKTIDSLWRHMWWQYAAGILLLVALGSSVYRTGVRHGTKIAKVAPAIQIPSTKRRGEGEGETPAASSPAAGSARKADRAALRAQLGTKAAEIARLESERSALEEKLLSRESDRDQMQQSAEDLIRQLVASRIDLEAAKQQLEDTGSKNSESTVQLLALQRQIDELKRNVAQRDQEIAHEQDLLDHDQDIRELMGSRNLYIAEVYDVARTGDTQRPFGRVFYTKGKSLIFYAYDLDQQPGVRDANSFQAWGQRGPDQARAVDLGILYVDNAAKKRWALKTDDPKTLSDIDAVFVTVEPPGGSTHPSGKPLLFAYLRIEPNHP
jgi:hypothetical protein